jgi:hypothetical protein
MKDIIAKLAALSGAPTTDKKVLADTTGKKQLTNSAPTKKAISNGAPTMKQLMEAVDAIGGHAAEKNWCYDCGHAAESEYNDMCTYCGSSNVGPDVAPEDRVPPMSEASQWEEQTRGLDEPGDGPIGEAKVKKPEAFRIDVLQGAKSILYKGLDKIGFYMDGENIDRSGYSDGSTAWSVVVYNDKYKTANDFETALRKGMGSAQDDEGGGWGGGGGNWDNWLRVTVFEFKEDDEAPPGYGESLGESEQINEYLVQGGSDFTDLLNLNLFSEVYGPDSIVNFGTDFRTSKAWRQVVQKYAPIAKGLEKEIKRNRGRKLTPEEADLADNTWYDGSDAYDDPEFAVETLPGIYDGQIEAIERILSGELDEATLGGPTQRSPEPDEDFNDDDGGCSECGTPYNPNWSYCHSCGDGAPEGDIDESTNHLGEQEYTSFHGWRAACRQKDPAVWFDGDKEIAQAMVGPRPYVRGATKSIGEWDGAVGSVYNDSPAMAAEGAYGDDGWEPPWEEPEQLERDPDREYDDMRQRELDETGGQMWEVSWWVEEKSYDDRPGREYSESELVSAPTAQAAFQIIKDRPKQVGKMRYDFKVLPAKAGKSDIDEGKEDDQYSLVAFDNIELFGDDNEGSGVSKTKIFSVKKNKEITVYVDFDYQLYHLGEGDSTEITSITTKKGKEIPHYMIDWDLDNLLMAIHDKLEEIGKGQVNELSNDTLASYKNKAEPVIGAFKYGPDSKVAQMDQRKVNNRAKGVVRANKKLKTEGKTTMRKNKLNEDVDVGNAGPELAKILRHFGKELADFQNNGELDDDLYGALYDYYFDEMPYGTKKARTGDPYEWISNRLDQDLGVPGDYSEHDIMGEKEHGNFDNVVSMPSFSKNEGAAGDVMPVESIDSLPDDEWYDSEGALSSDGAFDAGGHYDLERDVDRAEYNRDSVDPDPSGEVITELRVEDESRITDMLSNVGLDHGLDFWFEGDEIVVIGSREAKVVTSTVGGHIQSIDGEEFRIGMKPRAAKAAPSDLDDLAAVPELMDGMFEGKFKDQDTANKEKRDKAAAEARKKKADEKKKDLKEEVTADDIEMLNMKYKAGMITYDQFRSELDGLEQTDYSMRQGEMGNPDRQYQMSRDDDYDDFGNSLDGDEYGADDIDDEDHDYANALDDEQLEGEFANSAEDPQRPSVHTSTTDMINQGNDLNRPKKSYSHRPYRGDNPMAESNQLLKQYNVMKAAITLK